MINDLSNAIYENAKAKGFYDHAPSIGERIALIHSEVSEALEADRKGRWAHVEPNVKNALNTPCTTSIMANMWKDEFQKSIKDTFEDELADVMIRVMDLAAYKGIDLEFHVLTKIRYNSMREHMHGKKY